MLIADWMSTTVIKVEPGVSVTEAMDIQTRNDISILPVVEDEKLVGVVTDIDLKPFRSSAGASLDPLVIQRTKVEDVIRAPVTIPVDFTVGEAADAMLIGGVSGLVVVDANKHIVGVITQTDLNRVLVSVTGLLHGAIAFGFLIEDVPGSIKVLTDILRAFGGRLVSIMTGYIRAPKGHRRVHIRVRGLDRSRFDEMLGQLKQSSDILYIIDHRMNTRTYFHARNN